MVRFVTSTSVSLGHKHGIFNGMSVQPTHKHFLTSTSTYFALPCRIDATVCITHHQLASQQIAGWEWIQQLQTHIFIKLNQVLSLAPSVRKVSAVFTGHLSPPSLHGLACILCSRRPRSVLAQHDALRVGGIFRFLLCWWHLQQRGGHMCTAAPLCPTIWTPGNHLLESQRCAHSNSKRQKDSRSNSKC